MSAEDVIEPVAARIESAVGAARVVFRYGVPDGPLPDTYLLVTGSVGETSSGNLSGLADRRTASVDVKSISRSPDRRQAAREALWGSRKVVMSLTDFRPPWAVRRGSRTTWRPDAPTADDSLPDDVVMQAVARYTLAYQP
ncbi:MAG: hypothetical protein IPI16_16680 [Comamonadaceae bacterium]|nr:hypothetical protein [Comamonadaceae bacterium]